MSDATAEIIAVCEALPPAKRLEVADFAKFLLTQESDARWDAIIEDPQPRPKLAAFVEKAVAEGSEPLDLDRSDLANNANILGWSRLIQLRPRPRPNGSRPSPA